MARKITVVNQKGGVGKSTTVANLAVGLAMAGKRVLVIDLDPQGNVSEYLDLRDLLENNETKFYTTADFITGKGEFAPQRDQLVAGLDVLPATEELAYVEPTLWRESDTVLAAKFLDSAVKRVEGAYDYVLADCPPSLGLLAINGMVACPSILIAIKLSMASMRSTARLARHIEGMKTALQPQIETFGVLGTFLAGAANSPKEILEGLQIRFGEKVFKTHIGSYQSLDDAGGLGTPLILLKPSTEGAKQYQRLTEEVIARG